MSPRTSSAGRRLLLNSLARLASTLGVFVVLALAARTTAHAQTITWDAGNGTNFNWDTIQNWSGDTSKPVGTDGVLFPRPIPNPGSLANPGTIILTAGEVANSLTFDATYTLSGGTLALSTAGLNAGTVTVASDVHVTINSALTGPGSLTKLGHGRVALVGAQAYTGTTDVNGGQLLVNGSIAGATVTVNSGAVLGGSGTILSPVVVKSGTLTPGSEIWPITILNGSAQLDTGNLTFQSESQFLMDIHGPTAGADYDQINVTGTVALGGARINFVEGLLGNPQQLGDQFFAILNDGSDAVIGTFMGLPEGTKVGRQAGVDFYISYRGNGDGGPVGNDVVLAVPEPGSFASLLGGLGMLLGFQRFSRGR